MSESSRWERAREEVRSRVDFVALVEDYVTLEQRGKSHWGLCPFHAEDTPSFAVTPEMGIFKCFGCGEGGDVYDFVMAIEGCDFVEALRMLGERVGVELPDSGTKSPDEDDPRGRVLSLNRAAADRYEECLWGERGRDARGYLLERGYDEAVLREFEVGYSPDEWEFFTGVVRGGEHELEDALRVGLVGENDDGGYYDRFYDRIMFPIHNLSGRVIGFGGRRLSDDADAPKYFNSPESPVFKKRESLYGLPQARRAVRESGRCLLMEGYTDVLRCHQEGFEHAVATLGTALTEEHVGVLKRYTEEIVLVYDGDEAGIRAARRGGRVAVEGGLEASVVLLPPGRDPDDLLREDVSVFREHLEERTSYLRALFEWLTGENDPGTAGGKETILKALVPLIASLPTEVRRREAVGWLASRLSVEESLIYDLLSGRSAGPEGSVRDRLKRQGSQTIEEVFFRSLAYQPDRFEEALDRVEVEDFSDPRSRRLLEALGDLRRDDAAFSPEAWMDRLSGETAEYLAGLLSWDDESRFASGIDPVEVAKKLRVDASRRERGQLARTLSERDSGTEAGQLNEEKKELLRRTLENKLQEGRSRGED